MKRLVPLVLLVACLAAAAEDISQSGWRLWPDRDATWKDDAIYLPQDVDLAKLPVNPPTGGWQSLNDQQGIAVTLPSTVEEHFWGKFGTRPYTKSEAQRGDGTSFPNGNYLGVSWWWRDIQVPQFKSGQRVVVSFRGARLRSEVYCNGKLVGYTIMGELPFLADITSAVQPGQKAQLAVRITNPGGHLDWIDFSQMMIQWGKYQLPPSHGFGGLDSDIQLAVRDDVSVTDLAAINKPDLHEVQLRAEVSSVSRKFDGRIQFQINRDGKTIWHTNIVAAIASGETKTIAVDAHVDSAEPWDVPHPILYQARAVVDSLTASDRSVDFGFRYCTPVGIGSDDAKLRLNGKRLVAISAISWGYWGRNGLWPDQEMATREVSAAKELGLNCLSFHRNIGKPAVLDLQDRMGLLRSEEPGGGKFVLGARYAQGPFGTNGEFITEGEKLLSGFGPKKEYKEPASVDTSGDGPDGEPRAFWERYEQEKILRMVKRDRSHPSLILYTIQNESNEMDIRNPRIYRLFRLMHALDPSRIIAFYSGGVPAADQILMVPYSDEIRYGSKTLPFAGWKDCHTCGGPCNYLDRCYLNPTNFIQRQKEDDRKSICVWGEMLGAATPDDYDKLVNSFDAQHPTGYELDDARKVLVGYHQFLDRWGFRKAFATDSSLFQSIGYRTYYFWRRIIEQSRMDNANDWLVISGWESTTIDNHSGLVDNHRFFKSDPAILAEACKPEVLVIQPRHMIVAKGDKDVVDIFLLNETGRTGEQNLNLTIRRPDSSVAFTTNRDVSAVGGDNYGQLLAEGIEFATDTPGMLKLEATLTPKNPGATVLRRADEISVVDVAGVPLFQNIALVEPGQEVAIALNNVLKVTPQKLADVPLATRLDAIILAIKSTSRDLEKPAANPDSKKPVTVEIAPADFAESLDRVRKDGTRLILWPDNNAGAEAFARALARRGIVKYSGTVGNLNAPWFGSWFFTRKHWLLDGLPTDCAMDWRYGISAFGGPEWLKEQPKGTVTDGLLLDPAHMDAPDLEVFVGFGADHNTKVGVSGCVIPYGNGEIVLYCLPQLVRSLQPGDFAINHVIAQRLLANALRPSEK